jgi:hypothetical protein
MSRCPIFSHFELKFDLAADHLFGRDAVRLLGKGAHEFNTSAGADEGLEAIRAQVGEQFILRD